MAPAVCELGWALCTYIPHVRYRIKKEGFEKVVCCVPKGEEYLVQDFATDYRFYKKPDRADRWLIKNGKPIKMPMKVVEEFPGSVWIRPEERTCMNKHREYIKYGRKMDGIGYDVVIHARNCKKYGQHTRNYDPRHFAYIVRKLGVKACCVGTQADYIEGTEDKRNAGIEMISDIMASSKVVIGPSSGPMHLASLCGTPHVVFSGNSKERAIKCTNKERYTNLWNPFNTPCTVLDSDDWHPHPDKVIKVVKGYLC